MSKTNIASSAFFFLFFQLIISCSKNDIKITTKEELITELKSEMDKEKMTSMSFAVLKNDSLILTGALGYSHKKNNILATPETRYLIASVSKTITCVALLQLYEQSLFSLDDDINIFLPFNVRNPKFPNDKITFRMLLSHYSGISDSYQNTLDLDCYGSDCPMSLATYFNNVFPKSGKYYSTENYSNSKPGTTENYSNLGLALVGYLVERIAKQPFDTYCKTNIFQPLEMTKTDWRLNNVPQDQLAIPYSPDIKNANPHYTFPDYPNGGLRTTVFDLSKFLRAIVMNGSFRGNQILKPSTNNLIKTLQFGSNVQALTFYFETIKGERLLGHSGGEKGVSTEMFFNPLNNIGVIIFNNDDDINLNNTLSLLVNFGKNQ